MVRVTLQTLQIPLSASANPIPSYVIPMVAFSFLGIENVAVTAFEARSSRSLRLPSQIIAYITLTLYFLCMLGQLLNVSWKSNHLPLIYGGIGNSITDTKDLFNPRSSNLTVIALWDWGQKGIAGFLNGAMIFSVLSASNTSLYVASRTLYGLALDIPTTSRLGRLLHSFSVVVPQTGVPARALIFSALAFFWLPFINLRAGYAVQYVRHPPYSRLRRPN
jgi:amino acid transporter